MKFGVQWNVKGVRPEARDSARQAARRSGMSVGEWLNDVILEKAAGDLPAYEPEQRHPREERERLGDSIDRLDRRIDQLFARDHYPPAADPVYRPTHVYAPPVHAPVPLDPWPNTIEQAIAEISARQSMLDADQPMVPRPQATVPYAPPVPRYVSPPLAPMPRHDPIPRWPMQDLSGLERRLQQITEQIEKLHRPRDSDDIAAMRKELAEIGAKLTDAVPQRAIEALETEIRTLGTRLDQGRQSGIDPAILGNIERGLAEMRDALRELRPAESLSGYEDAIRNLAQRIDQMGPASQDPAFLQQLEAAIAALRGIVSHVASNESLARLGEEMRALTAKVEGLTVAGVAPEGISALEQRLMALGEQIKAGGEQGGAPAKLESLIRTLNEKFERKDITPGEQFALGNLEDRIVSLAAKLDASDARLNQLGAIERGIADLLVRIEEMRGGRSAPPSAPAAPAVSELKHDMMRTRDSLEAVHDTVGDVVDRIAQLESAAFEELQAAASPDRPAPAVAAPSGPDRPSPSANPDPSAAPRPVAVAGPTVQPKAGPPAMRPRPPIDPNLPPDYPLEPGSGGHGRPSAADRIAASEAALASATPMPSASSGSTNFIAAARRAAQAAAPADQPASTTAVADETSKPGGGLKKKMLSLFAGTGIILLVLGGMRVATTLDPLSGSAAIITSMLAGSPGRPDSEQAAAASAIAALPARAVESHVSQPTAPEGTATQVATGEDEPSTEITGSIPQAAAQPAEEPLAGVSTPARLTPPEKLPAPLRQAAGTGDPSAAYEVAMRLLEGRGIALNIEEAVPWLDRAARAGLAPAQFRLGNLYEKGQGVKKNLTLARQLYRAAADKGNAKAMHNLAVLFAEGATGKPDYKAAAHWFRKAAERGIADSQYNLGILYARGIGVEQNLPESYKWFALAASQGDKESAKKRDEVGGRLDTESLMAARLAIQTFVKLPEPAEAVKVSGPEGGWERTTPAVRHPPRKPRAIEPMRITPS